LKYANLHSQIAILQMQQSAIEL